MTKEKKVNLKKKNSKKKVVGDTYSYKGWLNSDNFFKRAFGVFGYSLVAQLLIQIPIIILMFIVIMWIMVIMGVTIGTVGNM